MVQAIPRPWFQSKLRWIAPIVIAAAGFAVYAGTFHHPFHLDDTHAIVNNESIRSFAPGVESLLALRMRSLTNLSFAMNYAMHGLELPGYHLGNISIHVGAALLVYWFVLLLCRAPLLENRREASDAPWIALFAGLLFAVHPAQIQSVTYLVQRFESLAASWYLLSVVCYLQARLRRLGGRPWRGWYAGALAAAVAGALSKEFTISLPGSIALLEACLFPGVRREFWRRSRSVVPFLLIALIIPISVWWVVAPAGGSVASGLSQLAGGEQSLSGSAIQPYTRGTYLLTQFRVVASYLRLMVLPTWQNIDPDVGASATLWEWRTFGSLAVIVMLIGGSVRWLKRWPLQATGILWLFLALMPRSSVLPFRDLYFEHRMYLPLSGAALTLAATYAGAGRALAASRSSARAVVACGVAVVVLFGAMTMRRNVTWSSSLRLWEDAVRKTPLKGRPRNNLGNAYGVIESWDRSMVEYKAALAVFPTFAEARNNLAVAYQHRGRFAQSAASARAAARYWPGYADAQNTLAVAYLELGFFNKAVAAALTAVRYAANSPDAHNNLGLAYLQRGYVSKAARELYAALALDPTHESAWSHLGDLYVMAARPIKAAAAFRTSIHGDTRNAITWNSLGYAWYQRLRMDRAASAILQGLRLDPRYAKAWSNLGNIYARRGLRKRASAALLRALRLQPGYEPARINLGSLLSGQGRHDAALLQFLLALRLNANRLESLFNIASMLNVRGRSEQALRWYERFRGSWRGAPSLARAAQGEIENLRRQLRGRR